jgi:succinate dehydrogenase/fumarate reductase flavoprotein subunit
MDYPAQSVVCDVAVIGGSSAALVAALEARKAGMNVLVVTKGLVGRGGNTIVSGAGFAAVLPGAGQQDSREQFQADILASGKGINHEHLVHVLTEHSGSAILDLEHYGVKFSKSNGDYVRRTPPGHSYPRQIPTVNDAGSYHTRGLTITIPLRDAAKRAGIAFLEKTSVIELLCDADSGVCGAVGISSGMSELIRISAKAVILATGGAGMIYERTNNTADVTGDGYGLALEAGASLVDMEFVQFYPTMAFKPVKVPISSPLFGDGAVLRNKDLDRFMTRYDPAGDMATRDVMSRAIFSEVSSGNGVENGVYIDCSAVPVAVFEKKHKAILKYLLANNINPQRDLLLISPSTHFFMGGVRLDGLSTGVRGLFAAGEVVGGLHGANRISGNALTETAVFGKIAGHMAAEYASTIRSIKLPAKKSVHEPGRRAGDLRELKSALRRTMWRYVSVQRSSDSLQRALLEIGDYRRELLELAADGLRNLAAWVQIKRMLTVSEAVTRSALMREESRGSHFRADFPDSDDSRWIGNIEVRLHENELRLAVHPKK